MELVHLISLWQKQDPDWFLHVTIANRHLKGRFFHLAYRHSRY
jgi:hypothetical protein